MDDITIEIDDPTRADVSALLEEHLSSMYEISPPESVHALDVTSLTKPGITFWSARQGELLLGCGGLKALDDSHGEIKSMRTPTRLRRRGAGRGILEHILSEARHRGYTRVSLETGPMDEFLPARQLYERFGFKICDPFGNYRLDPNSLFMTLEL